MHYFVDIRKHFNTAKLQIVLSVLIFCVLLAGCQHGKVLATYEYDLPESVNELTISKSVYTDKSLCIYVSGKDAKRITGCACYDKDSNLIKKDFNLSASSSKIVITGDGIDEISGITLYVESNESEYKVRFLDSNRCAMLYGMFVVDIGMDYIGDKERFKTQAERDLSAQAEKMKQAALDKAFGFLEGRWYAENDADKYIDVHSIDSGIRSFIMNGEAYGFETLRPSEDGNGNMEITISGDGWTTPFDTVFLDFENDCVMHFEEKYIRDTDDSEWNEEIFGSNPGKLYLYECSPIIFAGNTDAPKRSMRTTVNNSDEEASFISMFINDYESCTRYDYPDSNVIFEENDTENSMVFLISQNENSEYPKQACAFKYNREDMKLEAIIKTTSDDNNDLEFFSPNGPAYTDKNELEFFSPNGPAYTDKNELLNPFKDKYEYTETYDDNNRLIRKDYSSDLEKYGTYDSTGTIFYDESGELFRKDYYVTSGDRSTFYIRENNKLKWICDFGGMAYSTAEENADLEIGIEFKIYELRY